MDRSLHHLVLSRKYIVRQTAGFLRPWGPWGLGSLGLALGLQLQPQPQVPRSLTFSHSLTVYENHLLQVTIDLFPRLDMAPWDPPGPQSPTLTLLSIWPSLLRVPHWPGWWWPSPALITGVFPPAALFLPSPVSLGLAVLLSTGLGTTKPGLNYTWSGVIRVIYCTM